MIDSRPPEEHLTSYERAVCYYALPKVVAPVTFGLLVAYVICLLEALGLLVYALVNDDSSLTRWGIAAVGIMIAFGVFSFLFRAFLNDVRRRQLLKGGEMLSDHDFDKPDVPDPLEGNELLCYSLRGGPVDRVVKDNDGRILYTVKPGAEGRTRTVLDSGGTEILTLESARGPLSFGLDSGSPKSMRVLRGKTPVALVRRRLSMSEPAALIETLAPNTGPYLAKGRSLYKNDELVGRVYFVRHFAYLDVKREHLHDGLLGFFVAMA